MKFIFGSWKVQQNISIYYPDESDDSISNWCILEVDNEEEPIGLSIDCVISELLLKYPSEVEKYRNSKYNVYARKSTDDFFYEIKTLLK